MKPPISHSPIYPCQSLLFNVTSFLLTYSPTTTYRVVLGDHNIYEDDKTEQYMFVQYAIIHEGWNGDLSVGYVII